MSTPQSAIVPDHCKASIFIEADITTSDRAVIASACRQSLQAVERLQAQYPEATLGLTIAFGSTYWSSLGHAAEGREIKPFTPLGNGLAPATQHDVMFHIQSMRHDVSFSLAMEVLHAFDGHISVQDETHGFRWIEERGLEGFVDGSDNPQGEKIMQFGLIPDGQPDAGGSYVLLQKYRHDLKKWNQLPLEEQEAAIGRTKQTNVKLDKEVRLPDSHVMRVDLKENGVGLKIVRRSLPYGTASGEHGLVFIAYCGTLYNIEKQLLSMFGHTDGKHDLLLKHLSTAITGAYYYAPSIERLQNL